MRGCVSLHLEHVQLDPGVVIVPRAPRNLFNAGFGLTLQEI
jgi:hypothetical protein